MKKLVSSVVTLAAASTMAIAMGVTTPAAANPACAAYPPGSLYKVNITPTSKVVRKNGGIIITALTHRGSTRCGNQTIYFQYAKPGQHFHPYGSITTNDQGDGTKLITVPVNLTIRWVWYPTPHTVVTSAQAHLTAR